MGITPPYEKTPSPQKILLVWVQDIPEKIASTRPRARAYRARGECKHAKEVEKVPKKAENIKKSADVRRTKTYKELRRSMLDNLEARGLVESIYTEQVEQYMEFWAQARQLKDDVAERGITVYDEKRGMDVENRSVSLLVQVSRQMQNIYTTLGFKDVSASAKVMTDDDEDEL